MSGKSERMFCMTIQKATLLDHEKNGKIQEVGLAQIKTFYRNDAIFKVSGSRQIGNWLSNEIGNNAQETVKILYCNIKNEVIYSQNAFVGMISEASVSPFQIIQTAVILNTTRIIFSHNHPSGDVTPSQTDVEFANRLQLSLELVGMQLLDVFTISETNYCSFSEKQLLDQTAEVNLFS